MVTCVRRVKNILQNVHDREPTSRIEISREVYHVIRYVSIISCIHMLRGFKSLHGWRSRPLVHDLSSRAPVTPFNSCGRLRTSMCTGDHATGAGWGSAHTFVSELDQSRYTYQVHLVTVWVDKGETVWWPLAWTPVQLPKYRQRYSPLYMRNLVCHDPGQDIFQPSLLPGCSGYRHISGASVYARSARDSVKVVSLCFTYRL